jgi:hypothetical protein
MPDPGQTPVLQQHVTLREQDDLRLLGRLGELMPPDAVHRRVRDDFSTGRSSNGSFRRARWISIPAP